LAYNYLVTKVQRLVFEMEVSSTNLLELLSRSQQKEGKEDEI
jgi:CRISPR/Cas system-associated endoribonuclease Cas2